MNNILDTFCLTYNSTYHRIVKESPKNILQTKDTDKLAKIRKNIITADKNYYTCIVYLMFNADGIKFTEIKSEIEEIYNLNLSSDSENSSVDNDDNDYEFSEGDNLLNVSLHSSNYTPMGCSSNETKSLVSNEEDIKMKSDIDDDILEVEDCSKDNMEENSVHPHTYRKILLACNINKNFDRNIFPDGSEIFIYSNISRLKKYQTCILKNTSRVVKKGTNIFGLRGKVVGKGKKLNTYLIKFTYTNESIRTNYNISESKIYSISQDLCMINSEYKD